MKQHTNIVKKSLMLGALSVAGLFAAVTNAADHQEADGTRARVQADIGDYYVWHEGDQLNLILTFGTFAAPGEPARYDSDILFTFHFDTSVPANGESDVDLFARFAQDNTGAWGIEVSGVGDSALVGAVETVLEGPDFTAWSGLSDDPFFFDQTGFIETTTTGTLSFNPERDDIAGANVTAIAIQIPISAIQANGTSFQTWSTTGTL